MTLKRPAQVDADIYDKFILNVGQRLGIKEGAVKKCLEEAMLYWMKKKKSGGTSIN